MQHGSLRVRAHRSRRSCGLYRLARLHDSRRRRSRQPKSTEKIDKPLEQLFDRGIVLTARRAL